jgi:glycosyltransferase involved in cell wall biosynthesis
MFEYMAIGLPQVTSGFPLYKSVVEKHGCGICVDPLKPQEIADAIQKLISDRSLALEMGTNGITAAKAYTWNSEYAKALAVYQQMLS